MSKHANPLLRQLCIISYIRSNPYITKQELIFKLENRLLLEKSTLGLSTPTIDRDFNAIRSDLGLDIQYSAAHKGYYIEVTNYQDHIIANTVEAFEVFSALSLPTGFPECIIPEHRKPNGLHLFMDIVKFIMNKQCIALDYFKFDSESKTKPLIEPLALKESKSRWYLIGKTVENKEWRAYALDRINAIHVSGGKVRTKVKPKEIEALYHNSFAMFTSAEAPESVVLKVDKRDGNYIKSFPIHHSQIVTEHSDHFIIQLLINTTEDLIMELMSRAWSLEVISPLSLRATLHQHFKNAMQRNKAQ